MDKPMDQTGAYGHTGVERRQSHDTYEGIDRRASMTRLVLRRLWFLIAHTDTAPTRFSLALTAALWSFILALPGDSMSRPAYQYLAEAAGDNADLKWSAIWALSALLTFWRVFELRTRPTMALVLNVFNAVLFTLVPVAIVAARSDPPPAGTAPYVAFALASLWVAVRTNINPRTDFRSD